MKGHSRGFAHPGTSRTTPWNLPSGAGGRALRRSATAPSDSKVFAGVPGIVGDHGRLALEATDELPAFFLGRKFSLVVAGVVVPFQRVRVGQLRHERRRAPSWRSGNEELPLRLDRHRFDAARHGRPATRSLPLEPPPKRLGAPEKKHGNPRPHDPRPCDRVSPAE